MPSQFLNETQAIDRLLGGMVEDVDFDEASQNVALSIHIRYQCKIIIRGCPPRKNKV